MRRCHWLSALAGAAALAGCTSTTGPAPGPLLGVSSQQSTFPPLALTEAAAVRGSLADIRVDDIRVRVPEKLLVSEANNYYPRSDIVWHGDPPGDRRLQVRSIFETAARRATSTIDGGQPVVVDIEVLRFHALTPRTRYTVGGVHSIRFNLSLLDPETGRPLGAVQTVKADLKGYGGQRAIDAERQGLTQKVRITDHLGGVLAAQLGAPYVSDGAGLRDVSEPSAEFRAFPDG